MRSSAVAIRKDNKSFRIGVWGLVGIGIAIMLIMINMMVENPLFAATSSDGSSMPEFNFWLWPPPEFAPRPVWKGQAVDFGIAFEENLNGAVDSLRIDCGDGVWQDMAVPELQYGHILVVEDVLCETYESPDNYTAIVEIRSAYKVRTATTSVELDALPAVMIDPLVEAVDFGKIDENSLSSKKFSFVNPTKEDIEVSVLWENAGRLKVRFAESIKYSSDVLNGFSIFEPPDTDDGRPGYECKVENSEVLEETGENELIIIFSPEDHQCFMEHRELTGGISGNLRIDPGFVWNMDSKEISGTVMAGTLLYPDGPSKIFEWDVEMQDRFLLPGGGGVLVPFMGFELESGEEWNTEISFVPNRPGEVEQTLILRVGDWESSMVLSGVGIADRSRGNGSSDSSSSGSSGTPGIEGVVSGGGSPLSGAKVKIGSKPSIITGSDGRYGRDMPSGTYDVTASKSGCVTQTKKNVTVKQSRVFINFNLTC